MALLVVGDEGSSVEMEDRSSEESSVQAKVVFSVALLLLLVRAAPLASADASESSLKLGSRHLGMTTIAVFGLSERLKSITCLGLLLLAWNSSTAQEVAGDMAPRVTVESSANIVYLCCMYEINDERD